MTISYLFGSPEVPPIRSMGAILLSMTPVKDALRFVEDVDVIWVSSASK